MSKKDKERTAGSEDTSSKEGRFALDQFSEAMSKPGPEEETFFARRRERGLGVGLSEDGEIIYARSLRER
ncbi:hypothetical protein [Thioclava sp. IC9]|uniref:hypothetical protein n=1 Tax=Thioclava sp. IC9 TaxID=1973007 RepID=UPI000B53C820|nr:hypothetical protein [Thioclava sp. IC9]OWY06774.1 hypothetical protein B6V76_03015 [Thioclava sp. IC9]